MDSFMGNEAALVEHEDLDNQRYTTDVEDRCRRSSENKHIGSKGMMEDETRQKEQNHTPSSIKPRLRQLRRMNDTPSTTVIAKSPAWTPTWSLVRQRPETRQGCYQYCFSQEKAFDVTPDELSTRCSGEEIEDTNRPPSPYPTLTPPCVVSKHEQIVNSQTWRAPSITLVGVPPKTLGTFQVGQIVWIGSMANMTGSVLLGHEDFVPPSNAWNHLALLYAKYNALRGESCFECLKITSYSNCEATEEKTSAAMKWSREIVPCRRLLYLPFADDHPATVPEHRALNMPVLILDEGEMFEKTSYVNVERTFVIEEKFLREKLTERRILSKESMRAIKSYRKDRQYEGIFDPETGKPTSRKAMSRQLVIKGSEDDLSGKSRGQQFMSFSAAFLN
jgi:hypothetical protein